VDIDGRRVATVSAGSSPFCEDQLQSMIERAVASGRLSATTDLQQALAQSSIAMICVNADSSPEGVVDLSGLVQVIDLIIEAQRAGKFSGTIVIRSTVPPGTCDRLLMPILHSTGLPLVSNPEFLREGSAVKDFMHPSMIVIGGESAEAIQSVSDLYVSLDQRISVVGFREAEFIKYSCNVFHALKIAFANEIGGLCGAMGIDGERVMQVLRGDKKLNASAAYLTPGFAFGGYCLPKDTRALNACALNCAVDVPLLRAILPSNAEHLRRAVDSVLHLELDRIGVYGISFKGGTGDLRESPALVLVEELIERGKHVRIFDPLIDSSLVTAEGTSSGENIQDCMSPDLDAWLHEIDCVVLTQPVDGETMTRLEASELPVLDLWRPSSESRAPQVMGA
jgi:GDP-mannose 6-dehydrogenase